MNYRFAATLCDRRMPNDSVEQPRSASGGFFRKAARVATGHAAGYGVALGVSPLLARIYSAEAFGLYAVLVLAVSCFSVIASLRFDQAIPIARSKRTAGVLTEMALSTTAVLSIVLLLLASPMNYVICRWWSHYLPEYCLALLACTVVCIGSYQLVAAWLLRCTQYNDLAGMRVVFAVTMAVSQVAIPAGGGSKMLGLPAGQAVGFAAGALYGVWRGRRSYPKLQRLSRATVQRIGRRYRKFALFGMPAAIVSNVGVHVPALILVVCYGLEVAGMFALAQRVFTTPLTLLINSFSRVFYAEATRLRSAGELQALYRSTVSGGALLATGPVLIAAAAAPWCFGLVFSQEWASAGWICTLLAPMALTVTAWKAVSPVFDVIGAQDQRLYRELLCTSTIAGSLLIAWLVGWSPYWAIGAGSLGGTIGYATLIFVADRQVASQQTAPAMARGEAKLAA